MRILIAEDDIEMRSLLRLALEGEGYEVRDFCNGGELVEELERSRRWSTESSYALVISDVRMPGLTGLEVLAALYAYDWLPPVILITAFGDPLLHKEARRLGAVAVLDKPFETEALLDLVRKNTRTGEHDT